MKCSFTKQVTYKAVVKQHICYLLVEHQNGRYFISGESDLATDENLNVKLNLGSEVVNSSTDINPLYILPVAGVVLVIVMLIYRQKRKHPDVNLQVQKTPHDPWQSDPAEPLITSPSNLEDTGTRTVGKPVREATTLLSPVGRQPSAEKEKGDAFERYIVSKFKKENFELIEWRSDKYHEGIYASSSTLPDLEYRFTAKGYDLKFAIECKWRAEFFKGKIEWAKSHQLVTYRQYERERDINVFVLIGIGGQPDNPAAVYNIPLNEIHSTTLSQHQLKKYYRFRSGNFYLDPDAMKLE